LADGDRAEVGELARSGEAQVLLVRGEDEDRHLVVLGPELDRDALDDPLGHVQEQLEGVADLPLLAGHGGQAVDELLHSCSPDEPTAGPAIISAAAARLAITPREQDREARGAAAAQDLPEVPRPPPRPARPGVDLERPARGAEQARQLVAHQVARLAVA